MPVEGEEEHGTVVVMSEDVDNSMNHAAKDKRQPPMSAGADFVHEAPEQDGVDHKSSRRVQEVMSCDPEWVVEVQVIECARNHCRGWLQSHIPRIKIISDREQSQRKIRYHRSPQKRGFGEFVFCAEPFLDGGVDDKVGWDGVQSFFRIFSNSSTEGLSVGS